MITGLPAPENTALKDLKLLPHFPGLEAACFLSSSAFLAQLHHLHVVEAPRRSKENPAVFHRPQEFGFPFKPFGGKMEQKLQMRALCPD